jgi:hypothetical protein
MAFIAIPEMRSHERSLARIKNYTPPRMHYAQRNVIDVEQADPDARMCSPRQGFQLGSAGFLGSFTGNS